jgi:hypothetical protein
LPGCRQIRSRALIDHLCDKDLVGIGHRLRPRSGVYNRADGGRVAMRPAEFAEAQFTGMNTNAYPNSLPSTPSVLARFSRSDAQRFWISRAARTARLA